MTRRTFTRGTTERQAIDILAGGNRKAEEICRLLVMVASKVDPDDSVQSLGPLRDLRALDVEKDEIVRFYVDCCEKSVGAMLAVLHAWHQCLGVVTSDDIRAAIKDRRRLDLESIIEAVRADKPAFNPAA